VSNDAPADAAAKIAKLRSDLGHAHRVIAWLLIQRFRAPGGELTEIAIPYRVLDDLEHSVVLVRQHTNHNDTVHYMLVDKAEVVPL
jgi:hypothetical protein